MLVEHEHSKVGMAAVNLSVDVASGKTDSFLRGAILVGMNRAEHQLTMASGGLRRAEMRQIIDVYYDVNLKMYSGINLRRKD